MIWDVDDLGCRSVSHIDESNVINISPTIGDILLVMGGLSIGSVFGQGSWSVNDIIVLVTIFLFLVVILACTLMWATRPQPLAKKEVSGQNTSERNRPDRQLTHSNSGISKANSSDKSKSSRDKKKSKKRDKETSIDLEAGRRSSPLSSLQQIEADSYVGGHVSGTA